MGKLCQSFDNPLTNFTFNVIAFSLSTAGAVDLHKLPAAYTLSRPILYNLFFMDSIAAYP